MEESTIFDDVFRTMLERMPELIIAVINEVFHQEYPDDVQITQIRNEHMKSVGRIVSDSGILIEDRLYHIECESDPATGIMAIRMIEYDFFMGFERKKQEVVGVNEDGTMEKEYVIRFPYSCVLYLRDNRNTPDTLGMRMILADGKEVRYHVPVIKVQKYTKDEIFQKRLLFFIPFYFMRYEKQITSKNLNNEIHEKLLTDCRDICTKLEEKISVECNKDSGLYNDLIKLAVRISDYILADVPEIREEVNELMGGNILELESEKQRRLGREEGLEKGLRQGYDNCLALSAEILHLVNEGENDPIIIAEKCNCTAAEVKTILKAFGI